MIGELLKKKIVFLEIKEGSRGIETYINPAIDRLEDEHKDQIISFLDSAVKRMGKYDDVPRPRRK